MSRLFIKRVVGSYVLHRIDNNGVMTIIGDSEFLIRGTSPFYKLSTKNCDELFEKVDTQQLIQNMNWSGGDNCYVAKQAAFNQGAEAVLELKKDYIYTPADVRQILYKYISENSQDMIDNNHSWMARNIRNPDEIDVKIIMKNSRTGKISNGSDLEWDENGLCDSLIPWKDMDGFIKLEKQNNSI